MERILLIGLISLPLVLFLAFFANQVMQRTNSNVEPATSEADRLMELVTPD